MALPRRSRLSRAAFPAALAGRRASSPNFTVVMPREGAGAAVVVSKKTVRLSVTRHRLKRRVVEALRALPARPAALIVFPKASVATLSAPELRAELGALISKLAKIA